MNCASFYKSRAYFLVCPHHENWNKRKILTNLKLRKHLNRMGFEILLMANYKQIAKEIENFNFHEYASLLIFADFTCLHFVPEIDYPLDAIYSAIAHNDSLKCVTKLVISFSFLQAWTNEIDSDTDVSDGDYDEMPQAFYDDYATDFDINSRILTQSETFINKQIEKLEHIDMCVNELQVSEQNKIRSINNFTYIQCFQKEGFTNKIFADMISYYMKNYSREQSVQEIAETFSSAFRTQKYSDQAFYLTTCAGAGYIFQMNPALTMMITNLEFSQGELKNRPHAKQDIAKVHETFLKKKIQFYALCDGNLKDILSLMKRLRTSNFSWLKYLYIFISSHGDIGDIIYTKTEKYSIQDDIVKALVANETLKDVQKFILVNACRGETDPTKIYRVEEIKELMQLSNDKEKLEYFHDEKLMIIYSTQKGFVSLLYPDGAIFLQTFCEVFEKNFEEISMEIIGQKIIDRMNDYIGADQVPDFGPCNNLQHNIKMEFVNSINNRKALKNMARFFRRKFQQNPDILDVRKSTVQN